MDRIDFEIDQESLSLASNKNNYELVWKLPDDGEIKLERISAGKLPDSLRFGFLLLDRYNLSFFFFFFPFGPLLV